MKKVAVLTSASSWFVPYARQFRSFLSKHGYQAKLFYDHKKINAAQDMVFMLSYFHVVDQSFLKRNEYNLVVHESDLPKGRGWAPLFWQVIEGKKKIPIVLFEATTGADRGPIYLKDYILLKGHELHDELRELQGQKTIELCLRFLKEYSKLKPVRQKGKATVYRSREAKNSKLSVDKTLREQFDLLRTVNNREFPAFFNFKGHKYTIHISKDD